MANPHILAAASEFDSFKNYPPELTGSVVIGGTVSGVAGSNFVNFSTNIDLKRINSSFQVYMSTTKEPGRRYSLIGGYAPLRDGNIGVVVPYNVFFVFERNGTFLTCTASITNPYGSTMTLTSETITFYVVPFVGSFL